MSQPLMNDEYASIAGLNGRIVPVVVHFKKLAELPGDNYGRQTCPSKASSATCTRFILTFRPAKINAA